MGNFLKEINGVPRSAPVQGTDITSGSATAGQVLTANGSGGSAFTSLSAINTFNYLSSNLSVYGGTNTTLSFTGIDNSVIGVSAGNALTTGTDNTLIGYKSGFGLISNSFNTIIGSKTSNTLTGHDNVLIGYAVDSSNVLTTDNNMIAIGNSMSLSAASNNFSVLIGNAISAGPSSAQSVLVGYDAETGGTGTVALGYGSGSNGNTPTNLTAIGLFASANSNNSNMIAIGVSSLIGGTQSIAIGYKATDSNFNNSTILGQATVGNASCFVVGQTTNGSTVTTTTAANQICFGTSGANSIALSNMFLGKGAVGDTTAINCSIQPSPITGASNITGGALTIRSGNGTGTGGSGTIIFQTAPVGSTGSTPNTYSNAALFDSPGNLNLFKSLKMNGSTSGIMTMTASATTTSYSVILPAAQGAANSFLQNDGSGNLSWDTSTGSGSVVLATAPTLSNPIVGTQAQLDGSTKAASTSYVDTAVANAISGINPAVAVQAATTAASDTSGFTYNNGVSGVGATFTGIANTAVTIDGFTFTTIGQRLLVKNDTQSPSGAFNGIYYVTQVQTGLLPPILTRALDYDQPSDMNNTGAIPVINGTVNGTTQWVLTSQVVTVGTTPLTYTVFSRNPANYLLVANNLSDVANKSTSFNNISPMTTIGDIVYGGTSGTGTRLPIGSTGQLLSVIGGIPAWASLTVAQATIATQAISATTIDWSTGNLFTKTLSANTTFTFSNAISGQTLVVRLTNTSSNFTVTWPTVRWSGGTAPVMTVGAISDIYTFIYDGSNFYGSAVQNMS